MEELLRCTIALPLGSAASVETTREHSFMQTILDLSTFWTHLSLMGIAVLLISFIMVFLCSNCGNSCTTKGGRGIFHQSASKQMRCSTSLLLQFFDFYCRKQKLQTLFIPKLPGENLLTPCEAAESRFKTHPRSCWGRGP